MKVAVSADFHLTSRRENPERFQALEDIVEQMSELGADTLIVAGDLFDESSQNYAEFEGFCREHREVRFLILPGNHDGRLSNASLAAQNTEVITEPAMRTFGSEQPFLLIPFKPGRTMGEEVAPFAQELPPAAWILIGHGDWSEGVQEPNPLEPGVYMPLTRADIDSFRPAHAILGHIHKPGDFNRVHYVGSPCPVAISEIGRRRFLLVDTERLTLTPRPVNCGLLYLEADLIVLPRPDEVERVQQQAENVIAAWELQPHELDQARVRVRVRGYCTDKRQINTAVQEAFRDFNVHPDGEPDLSRLAVSEDVERAEVVQRTVAWLNKLRWPGEGIEPRKQDILMHALHVIYGE